MFGFVGACGVVLSINKPHAITNYCPPPPKQVELFFKSTNLSLFLTNLTQQEEKREQRRVRKHPKCMPTVSPRAQQVSSHIRSPCSVSSARPASGTSCRSRLALQHACVHLGLRAPKTLCVLSVGLDTTRTGSETKFVFRVQWQVTTLMFRQQLFSACLLSSAATDNKELFAEALASERQGTNSANGTEANGTAANQTGANDTMYTLQMVTATLLA